MIPMEGAFPRSDEEFIELGPRVVCWLRRENFGSPIRRWRNVVFYAMPSTERDQMRKRLGISRRKAVRRLKVQLGTGGLD